MAGSVIDSLVVTLGLDNKAFAEGVKGSTDQLAGFTKRLAGMFIAVRGIEDVVGYFKDLHAQLAEIGFTSRNLGVAGTELKRLGEVSELFGGQMQDAADSVSQLQSSVYNLRYKGQLSESLMMLQRFGVAYLTANGHAREFKDVALDASKAIERQAKATGMTKGERYQMALSFGFTGGIASAVAQGGKGLQDAMAKAKVDQRALTEKTIEGQVKLDQSLTRLKEVTAAQSSAVLATLTPAIERLAGWMRQLVNELLPKLVKAIESVINFFKNPPGWIKDLIHFLGPTGSLVAGLAALTFAMGAGGALIRMIGSLVAALALSPLNAGKAIAPLLGKLGGLGLAALAGYEGGKLLTDTLPKMLGAKQGLGDWLGSTISEAFGVGEKEAHAGEGPLPARGRIVRAPATPTAPRPGSAAQQAGAPGPGGPTASNGGTSVQIDSMTINTRATDADSIAGDMHGALRRKLLVANADGGVS